ncbi:outer dense fiber protein 2 isoform X2 [Oryzias latipes]|uniref:outer dense fiber protein 2 isoform X2 n=1 Tax=Oryzias latipes TaxID=8090 RepID=UPI0005CBE429|nr:outer dense fiber protein 2 isoform X2 [Oryzias latipes]
MLLTSQSEMETRLPAAPVHAQSPQTSPVHVHAGRSPGDAAQRREAGSEGRLRTPWIPPGRSSCRRNVFSYKTNRLQPQCDGVAPHVGLSKNPLDGQDRLVPKDQDANQLLRMLVEAEIDGVAVANQLSALKQTIDSIDKENRTPKSHMRTLRRHQRLLLEKMATFNRTNQSLRDLLRGWSKSERETLMCSEERDGLKKRVVDTEAENMRLVAKLTNTEKEASKLAEHLDLEKCHAKTTEDLSRVLESTRNHLEIQLSQAEKEKVRLIAQIQRMQQDFDQKQQEQQLLQEELQTLRQRREEQERQDKEVLQQLSQRAEQAEKSAGRLAEKLAEKDWCVRHAKEAASQVQLREDMSALQLQVQELHSQLLSAQTRSRAEKEELRDQLHLLGAENASTKLENHRLKSELNGSEQKVRELHSEARHLKSSIQKYEAQVEKYRKKVQSCSFVKQEVVLVRCTAVWSLQVQQGRLESDHFSLKLEVAQKDARDMKVSLERAKDQVRQELLGRLRELEMLPDRLRRTEQQLQEATQEAEALERRNQERSSALSEVRSKVEQQGSQVETLQQKHLLLLEENQLFKDKILNLDRQLNDLKVENRETLQTLASKENCIHALQLQLEEKTHECSVLSRELQQTLSDSQRQVDHSTQRLLAKDRASQTKALELQSQLSRAKTELSQTQRSKDEMERGFQSQLQNMKERLEHAASTNRTLQSYVQFLKASYGNVFGDTFLPG